VHSASTNKVLRSFGRANTPILYIRIVLPAAPGESYPAARCAVLGEAARHPPEFARYNSLRAAQVCTHPTEHSSTKLLLT
jgi:hypothetical protein